MNGAALKLQVPQPGSSWSEAQLEAVNPCLERMAAGQRVEWALGYLPETPVLTSSFGAQAAVMLHLVTRRVPGIPVVLIDTGYLFPETYRFIDDLVDRLDLSLRVYRPLLSAAWQELRGAEVGQRHVILFADAVDRDAFVEYIAGVAINSNVTGPVVGLASQRSHVPGVTR